MNKEDYEKKMEDILDGGDYAVVKANPTLKLEKKLNGLLRELWEKGEINKTGYDRLRTTYSATPQLYGLPKIHKPEVPLRPIVSSIDSPTLMNWPWNQPSSNQPHGSATSMTPLLSGMKEGTSCWTSLSI